MSSTARRNATQILAGVALAGITLYMWRQRRKRTNAKMVILDSPPIMGQEKYLGGVLGSDGKVYGIPGHAKRVLKIDPDSDEVSFIGDEYRGKYKWLRGVLASDGCVYGIPCHADRVLKIDPKTQEVTTFGGPFPGNWKWHGGVLAADGCIYAIPQMAEQVLKINVAEQECTLIGDKFPGRNKWYGGLLSPIDGNIYGALNITRQSASFGRELRLALNSPQVSARMRLRF